MCQSRPRRLRYATSQARFNFLDMRKQQRYGYPDGYYYYGDHGYEKEA